MTTTYSFSLEITDNPETYRGFVWKTMDHGYRPVTVVQDIGEGSLEGLSFWLATEHSYVTHVRHADGTESEPDCLTVFEAAEAMI